MKIRTFSFLHISVLNIVIKFPNQQLAVYGTNNWRKNPVRQRSGITEIWIVCTRRLVHHVQSTLYVPCGCKKKCKFRRSGRDFVVETSNRGIGIRQRRRYGILHSPLRVNYRKQLSILYLRYSTVFGYIYWAIKTPYNYSSMRCSQRTCLAASLMTASVLKIDCISG